MITTDLSKVPQYEILDDALYYTHTPIGSMVGTDNSSPPYIGKYYIEDNAECISGFEKLFVLLITQYGWSKCITGVAEVMNGVKYVLLNPQHFVCEQKSFPTYETVERIMNGMEGMSEVQWFVILLDDEENEFQYLNAIKRVAYCPKRK